MGSQKKSGKGKAPQALPTTNDVVAGEEAAQTRPTFPLALAVALRENPELGQTRVTAKGTGKTAEQILALAWANGVKVREDSDLAQILSVIEIDSPIPLKALAAVTEILQYVYMSNAGTPRMETLNDQL